MRTIHAFIVASLGALWASNAMATEALAKQNACMGCHAAQTKVLGPSFAEAAKRWKGKDIAGLQKAIKAGGTGRYGQIPMPAQDQLSEADAKKLAEWVMTFAADDAPPAAKKP